MIQYKFQSSFLKILEYVAFYLEFYNLGEIKLKVLTVYN